MILTHKYLEQLQQEDLTLELVEQLARDNLIVHHALKRLQHDKWTFEQSLIYALAWLVFEQGKYLVDN